MSAYLAKDRLLKSVLKKLIQISGNYSSLKKHFLKIFFKKSFLFDQNVESDWWRWESLHFLPLCLIIIFLFDTRASPFLFVDRRPIRFSNEKTAPAEAHRSAGRFDWRGRVFRSRTAFFIFSLLLLFFFISAPNCVGRSRKMRSGADNEGRDGAFWLVQIGSRDAST